MASQAAAVSRLQRRARAARHRLYRQDRQDPRKSDALRSSATSLARACSRRCSDHGRHDGDLPGRAAATSATGIPAGRHHRYPVCAAARSPASRRSFGRATGRARSVTAPRSSRPRIGRRASEPEDLLKYGLIPEFVGRLPVIATFEDLDEASLKLILTQPKNALVKQYQRLFEMEGSISL